jgi:hypothetical protein
LNDSRRGQRVPDAGRASGRKATHEVVNIERHDPMALGTAAAVIL